MGKNINSENPCETRLAGGQLRSSNKVTCHSEDNSNLMPEESKTDSSLSLRMTETCHCEDERSEDVTIQSIKLDYQVNILDSHVADAPQNDGKRAAFTLAETMIVLIILGIVAAITVPALVRNQMDAQNRTRLRKAMTVYDMAVNKIVVENGLKSDEAVYQIAPIGDCHFTSQYFKVAENVVENGNQNLCKFRTNDGVWWDISDILKPVIGLRADDLNNPNSDTRFQLVSHFDPNGALRVDDLAYELKINSNDLKSLQKIYAFINGEKIEQKTVKTITPYTRCDEGGNCSAYDKYGNKTAEGSDCSGSISSCKSSQNYNPKYDDDGNMIGYECNEDRTSCNTLFTYNTVENKTIRTERHGCSSAADISGCRGYTSYSTYDLEGRVTGEDCNVTGTSCAILYTYNTIGDKTIQALHFICSDAEVISGCTDWTSYSAYDSVGRLIGERCNADGSNCSTIYTITEEE